MFARPIRPSGMIKGAGTPGIDCVPRYIKATSALPIIMKTKNVVKRPCLFFSSVTVRFSSISRSVNFNLITAEIS